MVVASPKGRRSTKTKGTFYQKGNLESRHSISELQHLNQAWVESMESKSAFFLKSRLDIEI